MNQNLILRIVGVILCIEALCMIPPLLLSVFDGGVDQRAFLYALLICGGLVCQIEPLVGTISFFSVACFALSVVLLVWAFWGKDRKKPRS